MNTAIQPQYLPIGSPVTVHYMAASYYEKHTALVRYARRMAKLGGKRYANALARLSAHENMHNTN